MINLCPVHWGIKGSNEKHAIICLQFTMPRLRDDERNRAIGMLQANTPVNQVARIFGCNRKTITRLRQRYVHTNSVADGPRTGRPRVTTPEQDRYIRLQHLRDRYQTAVQTAAETRGVNQDRVSPSTVRRRLHENELRSRVPFVGQMLNPLRCRTRLAWARRYLRYTQREWRGVAFSDESRFCLFRNDGRQKVWRRRGERHAACCIRQHDRWGPGGVMVWAAISADHRTDLVFIDGNLTARRYIDQVLNPVLVPFLAAHNDVVTYQQDNARPHTARVTQEFLRQSDIDVMPWPPYSPDLSPIEHLWDQLGRRVANRLHTPTTRPELILALNQEWARIPQHNIRTLIRSMRRRCTSCIGADGGHTRY